MLTTIRSLVSIQDLSSKEIEEILHSAEQMQVDPPKDLLKGKILASCFFEPSTRTRLSFESAMYRLGGNCLGFAESKNTATAKGESLEDTIRVMANMADLIVIRHPKEGSARLAADVAHVPVINAGDGANQHPTQTLTDLYSIRKKQGTLENLHIALTGDLTFARTIHSLAQALSTYQPRLYFCSEGNLTLPEEILHYLKQRGIKFSFHETMQEILPKLDVLYLTRLQKERFTFSGAIKPAVPLKSADLADVKKTLQILHPLPRQEELPKEIDNTPYANYFEQAKNGVAIRMALLKRFL